MERVRFAGGGGVFIDQETLKLTRCGCVPQVSLGRIGVQKERQMLKIQKLYTSDEILKRSTNEFFIEALLYSRSYDVMKLHFFTI
jgi:hypothetical protein